ncbi:hypothetical protein NL676_002447 [Syzygium grande]|nr:hypothetical protein NL676_002447 [Syzygium grande]
MHRALRKPVSPLRLSQLRLFSPIRDLHGSARSYFAADPWSVHRGRPRPPRQGDPEGRLRREQAGGASLPLCLLRRSAPRHTLRPPHRQVPPFLPHPSGFANLQEEMPLTPSKAVNLAGSPYAGAYCREFCSVGDRVVDSDDEEVHGDDGSEGDGVGNGGGGAETRADRAEVDRVCKVIDELFALDQNMEAVLDECGVILSHDLVVDVLKRFCHARKPAFRFFCWAGLRPGFAHDSRTYNTMMDILGKTRQFETMVSMLEEMGTKGLLTMETFMIAIKAFAASKERKKAVGMFELMKKYKYKVGVDTINCLLDALGRASLERRRRRFSRRRVWNEMIDKGFTPDIVAHNTMLEGLLRSKKRSDAIKLFEVMKAKGPSPNVRSYTIMVRDFCKQGFGNQKRMDMVFRLLKEMKEKGCPPVGRTYNALIKLMTSRKMPDDAVRIYKKMVQSGIEPTIHTYNMMMKSFFTTRNYEMGRAAWDELVRRGCCPDDNSYTVFIGGLISQGRSEEACTYLEEMLEKGMKAPQLDYNKFAADFSRAGKPDILAELAKKMKFSGKFEVANVFARWAEMMNKRIKRRDPVKT